MLCKALGLVRWAGTEVTGNKVVIVYGNVGILMVEGGFRRGGGPRHRPRGDDVVAVLLQTGLWIKSSPGGR